MQPSQPARMTSASWSIGSGRACAAAPATRCSTSR
jgi:hypothetical protein